MSQVASRPASQMRASVTLPEIKHPFSQLGNLNGMDVRGVSRAGEPRPSSFLPQTGRPLPNEGSQSVRKSFSAFGRESRVGVKNKENINTPLPMAIPEGVEVKHGDPTSTRLPLFGNKASVGERDAVSRASSRMSHASGQARLEIDELESSLREKLKNKYYDVKKKFKDNDPEGRGNVSREAFTRILVTILGRSISSLQCQKLMERLGFAERTMIPFTEFFAYFRDEAASEYPQWMDPIQRIQQGRATMTSKQVHAYLKEKAKQRFLDLADMFPQMNPGGSGKIMKSEMNQMLNRMNFHMDEQEFEKLWLRYDPANEGVVNGQKLLNALGIEWRKSSSADSVNRVPPFQDSVERKANKEAEESECMARRSPRKNEIERKKQLNIEMWLKNKFREGFFNMREVFEEKDTEKTGVVSFDEFIEVLDKFGLKLDRHLLGNFLCRCSIKPVAKGVPYREFLHRFQDRGEQGITHAILTDVKHRFNNRPSSPDAKSTISAIEVQLTNMFQRDFLALLGIFRKIDRLGLDYISQEEFRAAIESRFNMELTEDQFESFIDRVPLDDDGNVLYPKFMQKFDARGQAPSLFDPRPLVVPAAEVKADAQCQNGKNESDDKKQGIAVTLPSIDEQSNTDKKRTPQEMSRLIKDLLSRRYQDVEQKFYDIDDTNTRRLTHEMMHHLLNAFDIRPEVTLGEIRDLWKTLITNSDKTLDYHQFVRHFGFSLRSAAFPNAKIQPPRRGDADFMMRSRKLNCAADMLQDNLRSKIDYLWDDLRLEFMNMDPYNTGHVTKEEFREVLTELCINLSNLELEQIISKFQVKQDGRVSYIELLRPFAMRKQVWRHGNNMLSLLQHSQPELPVHDVVESPHKGLPGITTKLRQKLSGDWKSLRRAFRKMDTAGSGYLSLPEFRSVLKLANVLLDEEDVYQVLNEFDRDLTGQISYEKFMDEALKTDTRQSIKVK